MSKRFSDFLFILWTGRRARRVVTKSAGTKLPDLKDHEAVQRFFLQEVSVFYFTTLHWQDDDDC
jgi:hypothetical protein